MNADRIFTITAKEWAQMFHGRIGWLKICSAPLLAVSLLVWLLRYLDSQNLNAFSSVVILAMLPTIPVGISANICAGGIVIEKITRSLEPLLATPVTTAELLIGKVLAAVIPALLELWLCYAILVAGTYRIATWSGFFCTWTWGVALLVVAPLLTGLAGIFALVISARSSDARKAQQNALQLASLISALFAGWILYAKFKLRWVIGLTFLWQMAFVLSVLVVILFFLAIRMFQRETILSNWK